MDPYRAPNLKPILLASFSFFLGLNLQLRAQTGTVPELMYFKFDGTATTVQNEASAPVGTNPAPLVTVTQGGTGQFGGALQGASGGELQTGWNTSISGDWTMSFYVNFGATASTFQYIFGDAGAGNLRIFANGAAGVGNIVLRGPVSDVVCSGVADGLPHVVHYVYSSASGDIRAYRDGVLNNTVVQTAIIPTGSGMTIGGHNSTDMQTGAIMDEFRLYNRALTPQEVDETWDEELPLSSAPNNAGVASIDSPSVFCPGIHNVVATIQNYGQNAIDSVRVNWSVDGIQQPTVHWVGTLDTAGGTGSHTAQVQLGAFNFATNNPYDVVAWTSFPNGVVDTVTNNDTASETLQSNLPPPGNIMVQSITATQATLTWSGGANNSWLWVNVPAGDPLVGVGTPVSTNSATVTGLTSETGYDFYVREVCPTGDTSLWAGPFLYITPFQCPPNAYCFLTCGAMGEFGPTQAQCNTVYSATNLAGQVTVTGGIQNWNVPSGGLYEITVYGAQGFGPFGGRGAKMTGEFLFNGTEQLKILVGQEGVPPTTGTNQYGGGGGTFVTDTANTPLIIAGGGGGSWASSYNSTTDASITTAGNTGANGPTNGAGGTAGMGGGTASSADGGGGLLGDGGGTAGGDAFINGGAGGHVTGHGGFGGGGGASSQNNRRSGGGGGYSGGGGAGSTTTGFPEGGGGGSFNSGTNQDNVAGVRFNDGVVIIRTLSSGAPNDIGVVSIDSPTVYCPGPQDVVATINNFGTTVVTSATLNWTVDGAPQSPASFSGTLDTIGGSGSTVAQVNLGSFNFATNNPYDIKVWTSNPNGATDTVGVNDTAETTVQSSLPPPTNIQMVTLAATQANLSWAGGSNNSWLWVNVPAGDPVSGTGNAVSSPAATVTGLVSETAYDFYVREVCPTGDTSAWAGPFFYITPFACPPNSVCFLPCGASGSQGPTQNDCNTTYAGTPLAGNVTVTGGIQNWMVPSGGQYAITVFGAQGFGPFGGRGAKMKGDFTFVGGEMLKILVGQKGAPPVGAGTNQYGGGGGTFITDNSNNPIIIAGGGGGSWAPAYNATTDASITTTGNTGANGPTNGAGGMNGNGGATASSADGGGGLLTDGGGTAGGQAFVNGGLGGLAPTNGGEGGFGGGGGASSWNNRRGGGGGGYSGGGGAGSTTTGFPEGGGGGSFNSGTNQDNQAGARFNDGVVIITPLSSGIANDVGVVSIDLPTNFCEGNEDVPVTILNFGISQVNSLTINWEINGAPQPSVNYTSLLDTFGGVGSSSAQVILGNVTFTSGTSYTIRAWTSDPNSLPDGLPANDSSEVVRDPLVQAVVSSITEDEACEIGNLVLSVVSNADNQEWYDDPALTVLLGTGPSITLTGATASNTVYFWGTNTNGCDANPVSVVGTISQTPTSDFTYVITGPTVDFTNAIVGSFDSVLWDFGDFTTSNVTNPSHTYSTTGTRLVRLTAYEGSCVDDTTQPIFVFVGMDGNVMPEGVSIYPNPSKGRFTLEVEGSKGYNLAEIVDARGVVVRRLELPQTNATLTREVDIRELPSGTYLLKLMGAETEHRIRIITNR